MIRRIRARESGMTAIRDGLGHFPAERGPVPKAPWEPAREASICLFIRFPPWSGLALGEIAQCHRQYKRFATNVKVKVAIITIVVLRWRGCRGG